MQNKSHQSSLNSNYTFQETFGKQYGLFIKSPYFQKTENQTLRESNQQNNRKLATVFKSKTTAHLKYKPQIQQYIDQISVESKGSKFEVTRIDDINNKINKLIKSISSTCQRKSKAKSRIRPDFQFREFEQQIDKCQSIEKSTKHFQNQTTEKKDKRTSFCSKQVRSEYLTLRQNEENESLSAIEIQQFEKLNERIKKISNKIYLHEAKIAASSSQTLKKQSGLKVNYNIANQQTHSAEMNFFNDQKIKKSHVQYVQSYKSNKPKLKNKQKSETLNFYKNKENLNIPKKFKQSESFLEVNKLKNSQLLSYKNTFLKSLIQQIGYDQDLRHNKHMFAGLLCFQQQLGSNSKWLNLHNQLKIQGFNFTIKEVKQIFQPKDDEIDPFMSVSHCHEQLIHGLIFAYQAAQNYWNQHILRSWTHWELRQAEFTMQKIDRDRKGYVTLEDLTTYVNTEIDGIYRNRDILLIFIRLLNQPYYQSSNSKNTMNLKFKQILNKLLSV